MHSQDLEMLLREYANATSPEEQLIRMELSNIVTLMQMSKGEEWQFAHAMGQKFCQVIRLLQSQHKREQAEPNDRGVPIAVPLHSYVPLSPADVSVDPSFDTGEELLEAFYNAFRSPDQREIGYADIADQAHRISLLEGDLPHAQSVEERSILEETIKREKAKINSTMKDYAARIKTFATARADKPYLRYMLDNGLLGDVGMGEEDPILFTYDNIELILARFDTKEQGKINKQKSNICSALRKLNQFKREWEAQL